MRPPIRHILLTLVLVTAAGCNTGQPLGGVAVGAYLGAMIGSVPGAGIGAIAGAAAVETNRAYYDTAPRCQELRGCVFQ